MDICHLLRVAAGNFKIEKFYSIEYIQKLNAMKFYK